MLMVYYRGFEYILQIAISRHGRSVTDVVGYISLDFDASNALGLILRYEPSCSENDFM